MTYVAQDRPRIGWIGTVRMGFQLAARLLDAGRDVAVCNRTRAKAGCCAGADHKVLATTAADPRSCLLPECGASAGG